MSAWPARVVLLGASGHIGRAVTARLERDRVTVVPHTSKTLDLTRPEALVALDGALGPDSALVFASALTPDRGQTPETFMANVAMATNLAKYRSECFQRATLDHPQSQRSEKHRGGYDPQ